MNYLVFSGLIISIVVLLLVILFFPVTVCINSSRSEGEMKGLFIIRWLIFNIRFSTAHRNTEISVFGRQIFQQTEKSIKKYVNRKKPEKVRKPMKLSDVPAFIGMSGPLLRFIKDFILCLKLKYFDMHMTFGMKNPASTGFLTGSIHALRGSLFTLSPAFENISWTADFRREVLEWDLKSEVACRPVMMLIPLVRFVTSRQVLRFARGFI